MQNKQVDPFFVSVQEQRNKKTPLCIDTEELLIQYLFHWNTFLKMKNKR